MISHEEYDRRRQQQDDWAPGWEAVETPFAALYPGVEPKHLATAMPARAIFGGPEHLDGVSFYPSAHGYLHVVTFGMSDLYGGPDSYGSEHSGWGYEMTAKVVADGVEDATWQAGSMGALARYTYGSQRWFEPYQTISGGDSPIRVGAQTALTSYLVVDDTEVAGLDTVHGRLEFRQLVGITSAERDWAVGDGTGAMERGRELADRLRAAGNPMLATDLSRGSVV